MPSSIDQNRPNSTMYMIQKNTNQPASVYHQQPQTKQNSNNNNYNNNADESLSTMGDNLFKRSELSGPRFEVQHLATFAIGTEHGLLRAEDGMRKLRIMEKSQGIWPMDCEIMIDKKYLIIYDKKTSQEVEIFPLYLIHEPTSVTSDDKKDVYDNILLYTVSDNTKKKNSTQPEMHIFQCLANHSTEIVDEILKTKDGQNLPSSNNIRNQDIHSADSRNNNTNTTNITNQKPNEGYEMYRKTLLASSNINSNNNSDDFNNNNITSRPTHVQQKPQNRVNNYNSNSNLQNRRLQQQNFADYNDDMSEKNLQPQQQSTSRTTTSAHHHNHNHNSRNSVAGSTTAPLSVYSAYSESIDQDVQILNHCFDDIERFVTRLQTSSDYFKELERRQKQRKSRKKQLGDGMLTLRAQMPPQQHFTDIFQKFKLSFNLLAKLKAHIHDPNAPELVHFLFTPLSLIINATKEIQSSRGITKTVWSPLITREAKELLLNCLTSKEQDLWQSLGEAWTLSKEEMKNQPHNFHYIEPYNPIFYDGWTPALEQLDAHSEISRLAFQAASQPHQQLTQSQLAQQALQAQQAAAIANQKQRVQQNLQNKSSRSSTNTTTTNNNNNNIANSNAGNLSVDTNLNNAINNNQNGNGNSSSNVNGYLATQRNDDEMRNWAINLIYKGSKIFEVLHDRQGHNDKELTIRSGELVEILDDKRNWWRVRNIYGHVGHVPNTILQAYDFILPVVANQPHINGNFDVDFEKNQTHTNGNNQHELPSPNPNQLLISNNNNDLYSNFNNTNQQQVNSNHQTLQQNGKKI